VEMIMNLSVPKIREISCLVEELLGSEEGPC
jgi:hypothetical protein